MDFETLVRYLVPGTIAVAPITLWLLYSKVGSDFISGFGTVLVAITIPIGYIVHQLWFAYFNATSGYVSSKRRNLVYLVQEYQRANGVTPTIEHAYFAWEDWVYSGIVPSGHLQRARRLWQLFHGLRSSVLATIIGLAIIVGQYIHGAVPLVPSLFCAGIYVAIMIFLVVHSNDIRRQVDEWELMMAVEDVTNQAQLINDVSKFMRILSHMDPHK